MPFDPNKLYTWDGEDCFIIARPIAFRDNEVQFIATYYGDGDDVETLVMEWAVNDMTDPSWTDEVSNIKELVR